MLDKCLSRKAVKVFGIIICAFMIMVPSIKADGYMRLSCPKPYVTDGYVVCLNSIGMDEEYISVLINVTALKNYNEYPGLTIASNGLFLAGLDENDSIVSFHPYVFSNAGERPTYKHLQGPKFYSNSELRPYFRKKEQANFILYFGGTFPKGVKKFSIMRDIQRYRDSCFSFKGVSVDLAPTESRLSLKNEEEIKSEIDSKGDKLCGIYESNNRRYALLKEGNMYQIYYIDDRPLNFWQFGDRKATLYRSGNGYNLEGRVRTADELCFEDVRVECNPFKLSAYAERFKFGLFGKTDRIEVQECVETFRKIYPLVDEAEIHQQQKSAQSWTGTGFALKEGYIVTNHHVAEGAGKIEIWGVNGDFTTPREAKIVGVDKVADIALLKLTDKSAYPNGIPYCVKSTMSEVGENVFVLGYPLIGTMGEEVKLTDGIISSRSGFDGDVTNYQISVPVQPGNSGGPMFDGNGNLVGIVCAKHNGAENVGYAIKTSYLLNMIESVASSNIIPQTTTLKGKSLTDQVKIIKDYTYLIRCTK